MQNASEISASAFLPHGKVAVFSRLASLGDLLRHIGGHGRGPVPHRHALDTGPDANVNQPGLNVGRNVDDGLQARRALAVGRVERGLFWVARVQGRHARHRRPSSSLQDCADTDVVNKGRVDLGAVLDRDQDSGEKILTIER